ncbi:MAG: hypothetical protein MSA90_13115 [Faecalicatena sp.]|uniref:hypothetical protein n=1 Tax=Faecalicatena sp. TaxID=2005360 RepID=UPI002586808F|nr:hypothetical protein [Faecalicatena sp.]MCI6466395.1 hypothetical protein [Faecalicatena sp.]MCI7182366.1 hypothetical protein [Lachnospiraceae bacterium]MDY5619011.1 hypothetical protein [Lachnospiraceae bacterium]
MGKIETNSVKNENELKKDYLRSYGKHVRRIRRIESEIPEIRSMRISPSLNNDGMPHGTSGTGDLSSYAADLDSMERELQEERYSRVKAYQDIAQRIKSLKSENEKDVLFYRYIKELEWWEIAEKMRYSERWVHKLHGRALAHFKIPKEFIEVQSDM